MSHALRRALAATARAHPAAKRTLKSVEDRVASFHHALAARIPGLIAPKPYKLMIAVTADCNARCEGCRYGRDFMPGSVLELELVLGALEDARAAGFHSIRLYGGEPLLHPDLPRMVQRCVELDLRPYVTTNGALLLRKLPALFDAGLRDLTLGFYGVGQDYDEYVGRPGFFALMERGVAHARERYGEALDLQLNYLLKRPTCSVRHLREAWEFALRYRMPMRVDLVHYSLPYFQEGENRRLQFSPKDRPEIEEVVGELLRLKREHPDMLAHSAEGLRSIPDWLILGPNMRVPCTAYEMIWIGADGTVQMCYVTFKLGNLHEQRLSRLLFGEAHRCAAKDAFALRCPNCHCSSNERVMRHAPTRRRYSAQA
jgi:cyclic pyranopterin phosphate synthase